MSTGEMSRLLTLLLIIHSQHMLVSANVCDASFFQCDEQSATFSSESYALAYRNNNPECGYVCHEQCTAQTSQGCSSKRWVCKRSNNKKPNPITTCPDRTTSNHYMNFNKLSKDFFCSWMHRKPYNIPLQSATSNSQTLISNNFFNNLCTPNNNGDNCKDLLMYSNPNTCSISSGNILIVPKPKISIEQTLFASWDSIVPAATTRMKEWYGARRTACMNGEGHPVLCLDDAKYATRSPTCNTCQNEQPDCIESRFAYFKPKEDTRCANKIQDKQVVTCYNPGVPGLTGWNEDATIAYCKDHAEADPYIWTSKPADVDSNEYEDKLVPSTYVMIAGMTRGCFQNRNAVSGSICAFVNAGCLVRLNNQNHLDFGKWMGMQNRQIYEIPGFTQAQEFKEADDSTYTIIIPGGGVQITAWSNPYCQHNPVKTWEFTQDNDEQEIQFDRTYGETSTQYHSIEFTFLDDNTADDEQKACLGPVAACASGWGVSDPTTLSLEVTCQKCQPGEYSDPVKREDLFPSYTPCDNDIDIIYPICKACEANYITNEQKTGCVPCMAVNDRRPYRPVDSDSCTSCPPDTYWSVPDSDCLPIPLMELTCHDNPATDIALINPEYDNFRRNPTINQLTYEPVPNGYFLNLQNRTIHRCDSVCSTYEYNHACGQPYLHNGYYNMYLIPTITTDISISNVHSVSNILSCDGLDAYTLDRRGRCRHCTSCTNTEYNDGCGKVVNGETQPGTCTTCVSYNDCSVNEYPYHIRSEGCAHEQAQTNAECRTCPVIEVDNDQYYIVLGCGKATTFNRWRNWVDATNQIETDPSQTDASDIDTLKHIICDYSSSTTILELECALKVGTLTENIPNRLLKHQWRKIPYCPRGWYISQTPQLDEWDPNLCRKCNTGQPSQKRSETYKPCEGSGTSDTQTWVKSCEHNYYEFLGSCKNCETCSAGMITKVQLGN